MKSLLDSAARQQILTRFDKFTESSPRQWGKMTNGQMLSHLIDLFEVTYAERPVTERKGIMNSFLGRWMLSTMPLPRIHPPTPNTSNGLLVTSQRIRLVSWTTSSALPSRTSTLSGPVRGWER